MSSGSLVLSKTNPDTFGAIHLTGSKSECNRALILNALSKGIVEINNISSAEDTQTLFHILEIQKLNTGSQLQTIDIGPAGTAMRFLTAYFAVTGKEIVLTGTERMKQRPIGLLVDALRDLGAKIDYTEKEGYPPLQFYNGFRQQKKHIRLQGDVSSQYITALLLIAPTLPLGLELEIVGELTSRPYVEMTLSMLKETGISYQWNGQTLVIEPQFFQPATLIVEPDWSAASYWYAIAALSENAEITLPYLKKNSLQGDSAIAEIMEHFGVSTEFAEDGIKLVKKATTTFTQNFFDLKDCPDLAQTVVVCAAALGLNATFTGLETLKIKETDRVKALQDELAKIGVQFTETTKNYHLDCSNLHFPDKVSVKTYEDHRMAMAFAPLALCVKQVEIEEPNVVGKSYPSFWEDLKKVGFEVK